jgi:hypothetical protein
MEVKPVISDCPSRASAELVPMPSTIMAARSMVFMDMFLWALACGLAEIGVSGLRKMLTKRPNENHRFIAFPGEHNSAIYFDGLPGPIALFNPANQIGLPGR